MSGACSRGELCRGHSGRSSCIELLSLWEGGWYEAGEHLENLGWYENTQAATTGGWRGSPRKGNGPFKTRTSP